MVRFSKARAALTLAGLAASCAADQSSETCIDIPASSGQQYGITLDAFISYSIEFSSFVDFAGNTSCPNDFSNNLLNNIAHYTTAKPLIRVGGNTQDYAIFNASQKAAIIGIIEPNVSTDYPRIVTIGPDFYDSFHTWPDTKYIYGFNLAANGSVGRESLLATAEYACKSLETGLLAYWELGNEPDLYSTSAQGPRRPPSWNEVEYVSEWLNGTRAIKKVIEQYCPRLATDKRYKYYAPDFAGTDNHLKMVTTWKDGLDVDRDIAIITSHNYIGGATQPGVTLQRTLMNHTSTTDSVDKQIAEMQALNQLDDDSLPFILGETNSLYNEGKPGLSNSFGAALWSLDFALYCAANNISRLHYHQGTNYRYQSWQPIETSKTTKGTKAPYYGNVAAAAVVGSPGPQIINIPLAQSNESAYATYQDGLPTKVVLINMQEYNSTGNYTDDYPRPQYTYNLALPAACKGSTIGLQRLLANGSDAITGVTFDGYSYNYELDNGKPVLLTNVTRGETTTVVDGVATVTLPASSALVLNLDCK